MQTLNSNNSRSEEQNRSSESVQCRNIPLKMKIGCLHHALLLLLPTLISLVQSTFDNVQRIYGVLGSQTFIPTSTELHPKGETLECRFRRAGEEDVNVIILCGILWSTCSFGPLVDRGRFELLFPNLIILLRDLRTEDSGRYSCTITGNNSQPVTMSSDLQVIDNVSKSMGKENRSTCVYRHCEVDTNTESFTNVTEVNTMWLMRKLTYGLSIVNLMLVVCSIVTIFFAYKVSKGFRMRTSNRIFFRSYIVVNAVNIISVIAMFFTWIGAGGSALGFGMLMVPFFIGFLLVSLRLIIDFTHRICINNKLFFNILDISVYTMTIVLFFASIIAITMTAPARGQDYNDVHMRLIPVFLIVFFPAIFYAYHRRKSMQFPQSERQEADGDQTKIPMNEITSTNEMRRL